MASPAAEAGSASLLASSAKDKGNIDNDVKEFDNMVAKALARALQGSADLANMLPTGTVLLFHALDPIVRRAGSCHDKAFSAAFLAICSVICFLISFTDSFQAPNGKVYYGFATFKGLWIPQLKQPPPGVDFSKYKINAGDFVHAVLAVYLFLTTTAVSTDIISCFFKVPDEVVRSAPSVSAFLVSSVFLLFPTTRHGIGFPVSPPSKTTSSKSEV